MSHEEERMESDLNTFEKLDINADVIDKEKYGEWEEMDKSKKKEKRKFKGYGTEKESKNP